MNEKINNIIITPWLYLQMVGVILLVVGGGLFCYCILFNINIGLVEMYSNPLFYLVLGLCSIVFSFFVKKYGLEVDS